MLEDARKKSLRILKTAEDTINTQNRHWNDKTSAALNVLEIKFNKQAEIETENIMSRLPIDKQRAKIEKTESLLGAAVESWYTGLDRKKILDLLSSELTKRFLYCRDQLNENDEIKANVSGLEQSEALDILNAFCIQNNVNIPPFSALSARCLYPSIILEAGDIRIISSIEKTIDYVLHEKRAELTEALTGCNFFGQA